jgi:hypothetical protein
MKIKFLKETEGKELNEVEKPLSLYSKEEEAIINAFIFNEEGLLEEEYNSLEDFSNSIVEYYGGEKEDTLEWVKYMIKEGILGVE